MQKIHAPSCAHCRPGDGSRDRVNRPRSGFTLVELLVVTGIVATLVSILLPVLSRVREQARMLNELSAARQLMLAYTAYATDNNGRLIPGRVDQALSWPVKDDLGEQIKWPGNERWPWRLMNDTRNGCFGTLLVNEQADALADRGRADWNYSVSVYPSFGLNFSNVGGVVVRPPTPGNLSGCITRLSQAVEPSSLLVFASARSNTGGGWWRLTSPRQPGEWGYGWTADAYDPAVDAAAWGNVAFRWRGKAACAMLDGHVEMLNEAELRDMRRWSNEAARLNDANYFKP